MVGFDGLAWWAKHKSWANVAPLGLCCTLKKSGGAWGEMALIIYLVAHAQ
jgi:hypothetical protein